MKQKITLLAMAILASISCNALNYYWIGGSGNWSDFGNHWSTTSGGIGGTFHNQWPQSTDNVFFDANSFTAPSQIVTIDQGIASCADMTWTTLPTVFPILYGDSSKTFRIWGSLTISTVIGFNFNGEVFMEANTIGKTITTGGTPINFHWTFNGTGGGWTFQSALMGSSVINLINGNLNTNNQTINASAFYSNSSSFRTLLMGSSIFNLKGYNNGLWNINPIGMNLNAGTSTINGTSTIGSGGNFYGGGLTYYNMSFADSASIFGNNTFHDVAFVSDGFISGNNSFHDVSFFLHANINGNSIFNNVIMSGNGNINGSNTFNNLTFTPWWTYTLQAGAIQTIGNICAQGTGALPIRIQSSITGTPAIISKASGSICWDYVRVSDITATGGATFNAGLAPTNSQDLGGNTGLLFTGGCTAMSCLLSCNPPSITTQPINSSVCVGSNAVFTITATGTDLTYQWQVNQGMGFVNLSNNIPYSGVTSNTLSISAPAIIFNGYQYRCAAVGACPIVSMSNAATLTVKTSPTVTVNSAIICSGQTAMLTASTGTVFVPVAPLLPPAPPLPPPPTTTSYIWSTGETTNPISVVPSTTTSYTVTATTNGCSGTAIATVTVNSVPVVSVNSVTINSGQTATLIASGATTYNWSTGETTNSISVSPATKTTYTVTGTTNTCSGIAISTVTVNSLPSLTITPVGPYNITDLPVTLNASIAGGVWSGNGITDALNGVFSPSIAGAGRHTILYFLTGPFGDTATTEIMVNAFIDADFIPQSQQNNAAFATIFDRFGNAYTSDDITIKHNQHEPGQGACTANYFNLDFVGSGWTGSNSVPMQSLLCQVFKDLSTLIEPSQCGGNFPIVNIQVLVPSNMPPNALGAATPYFTICCPNDNTGIIDGDVWKAINSGVNDPTLYDGELQVNLAPNWNFNSTSTSFPTQYDAYSVYLHEAIHLLGFLSLIGPNGQSGAPGLAHHYSRFDSYLESNSNGELITWDNCYNATFNALALGDITNTNQCSNIIFNAPFAGQQPVTASSPYQQGTSLSHFNNNCGGANNYVMAPTLGLGQFHRVPTLQEVNTLEDLGYHTTGVFGTSPTVPTTGLPAGGQVVAGVDDGFGTGCGSSDLHICATQTILVSPLTNDIGVGVNGSTGTVDCLRNTSGFGSFTISGSTFTFNPGGQAGIASFTYIPVSSAGQRGNITCIRIVVSSCGATCSSLLNCNQICNPDFTDLQNCFISGDPSFDPGWCNYCPFCLTNGVNGHWFQSHGSPQIRNSIGTAPVPVPGGVGTPETVLMAADVANGSGEGIITSFINVQPGVSYTFSYSRRRMSNSGTPFPIIDNIHIRLLNSTQLNGINIPTLNYAIPAIPPNFEILHETNVISTNWDQVTVCFTTPSNGPAYDWLWIYPEQNVGGSPFSILLVDWVQLMEDNFTAGNDQTITCGDVTVGVTPLCAVKNVSQQWAWGSNTSLDPQLTFAGSSQLQQTTTFTLTRNFPPNPSGVSNSCVTSANVTVTINSPIQLVATNTPDCGSNNGTASVTVTGGTAPYTFQWIDINNNILTTQSVTGLAAGTYTIMVTDANGCSGSIVTTVTSNSGPTVTVNSTTICAGQTTTLTATGATTYSWSNGATTNPITVSPSTTTTYTVTETSSGCSMTAIATVTVKPLPNLSVASLTICTGQTAILNAIGATNYSWSTGATVSSITVSPLTTTSYTVTSTSNGCSKSVVATVTVNPKPQIDPFNPLPTICSGDPINLVPYFIPTGGTFTTSGTTSAVGIFNSLTPGTFPVTYTLNGCGTTVNITVSGNCCTSTANPPITVPSGGALSTSFGGSFPATPGTIAINGNFTIPINASFLIASRTLLFAPNVKIIVMYGATLTINSSTLYSCSTRMWDGIVVQSGGKLVFTNSFIEDAKIAVSIENTGVNATDVANNFQIEKVSFNRNYIGVKVFNYTLGTLHPGFIRHCTFDSNPTFATGNVSTLDAPYNTQTAEIGIELDNVNYIQIGDAFSSQLTNYFKKLRIGIRAQNSGYYVYNNEFKNNFPTPSCIESHGGPPCPIVGWAIWNTNTACIIGGYLPNQKNNFENLSNGILHEKGWYLVVQKNTFTNITSGLNVNSVAINTNAFPFEASLLHTVQIADNIFNKLETGLSHKNNISTAYSVYGNTFKNFSEKGISAVQNTLGSINIGGLSTLRNSFAQLPSTSNINDIAIDISSAVLPLSASYTGVNIINNTIDTKVSKGISLNNIKAPQVLNNIIDLKTTNAPSSSAAYFGIKALHCSNEFINLNQITRGNPKPSAAFENNVYGITVETSTGGTTVSENTTVNLGTGIRFRTYTTANSAVKCNIMTNNWSGLTVDGSNIGAQGQSAIASPPNGIASDNKWSNIPNSMNGSFSVHGKGAYTQVLFYTRSAGPPWCPVGSNISPNQTIITTANGGGPTLLVNLATQSCSNICYNPPFCPKHAILAQIARNQNPFNSVTGTSRFTMQEAVVRSVMSDSIHPDITTIDGHDLQAFIDTTLSNTNVGRLVTVSNLYASGDTAAAIALNNSIVPIECADEYHQTVNTIFFNTWGIGVFYFSTADSITLYNIAVQDPLLCGTAIYDARVMLGIDINDFSMDGSRMLEIPGEGGVITDKVGILYPNPAQNKCTYEATLSEMESGMITMYDLNGKLLSSYKLNSGYNNIDIDLSILSNGIYLYKIYVNGDLQDYKKLVITK